MNKPDNVLNMLRKGSKRLRVILFSLFAFCILAASLSFFALSIGKPYTGVTLSMDAQGWAVQSLNSNGLAIQAGISVGDRPIEINGQPSDIFLEKYIKTGAVHSFLIRELTVVDNSGQLISVTLKDSHPSWESEIELLTWFVACLIFWITGFYVFYQKPGNIAALLLCLCSLTFGVGLSGTWAAETGIPAALQLGIIASVIGPWLLLHFFLILPEERVKLHRNPLVYLVYLPAVITLILFPLIGYADGQPLPAFRTFRLFEICAGFLATAGMALFNYLLSTSPRTRQQMRIVLIACLAAVVPFLALYLLPGAIWHRVIVPSGFSMLLIVFIPIGMGYAVVKQKLMDIDVIIRRSIIYGLIAIVMAVILSVGIFAMVAFHDSLWIAQQIALALLLGGIATTLFGPTKEKVEIFVDKFFYKDRYDYRQIIQSLSTSLNLLKDPTEISRLIVGTTVHTLNLAGGCLFIKPQHASLEISATQGIFTDTIKQNQLSALVSQRSQMIEFPNSASAVCSDLTFLIPLAAAEREVGVLCISQKTSRQDFSSDDMYLLQGMASVAATALHSAMLIRDVSIRDTFVSVASHELRTPLTAIVGYADLLTRRDPPDTTRKRWLKNILDNSQRIRATVDDLLNVSRIASGKVNIKLERVKLPDVFEETLFLIRESTNKHEFVVDIEPDLPELLVDRDKFSQVIGNLLSNAVKYSPYGGRITLSAHNKEEQHLIVVSVADEGIGIRPADKDLLFMTFHRIQRPETEGIRGSGLGLYIAKEWTEAMGGKIWLESELNKGSTFFIAIPMRDSGWIDREVRLF
jgi:signal transduction histidine kinase